MRRSIQAKFQLRSDCYLCEKCEQYHVRAIIADPTDREILRLVALGYRQPEIAEMAKLPSEDAVYMRLKRLSKRLYALSTYNLIAIAITLGIINTLDFVPEIGGDTHGAACNL